MNSLPKTEVIQHELRMSKISHISFELHMR